MIKIEDFPEPVIIIVVVILILIVIGIIIGCVYCCCCRQRKTNTKRRTKAGSVKRGKRVRTSNTLDLHGHSVKGAKRSVNKFLKNKKQERGRSNGSKTLAIIPGKGNHSPDGRAVLKPAILKHLRKYGYKCRKDPQNDGRVLVDRDYYDIV
ncbi:uncharacterized protein [Haliotis cracherodii]|uniref:uncharacterized protein n=1 Tax=Haliotis cracherodii TaxID=6455 RepID=UPI0039E97E8B